jgi:hypothetical protein
VGADQIGINMKIMFSGAAFAAAMALACPASASTNLLVNGSFETGDFTGWTLSGNTGYLGVVTSFSGVLPENGSYEVYAGSIGSDVGISQTFSDTAGTTYTASGYVYGFGGTPSDFGMQIDGTSYIYVNPYPASGWTQYSFTFTGTGSDTFTIVNRNDPSYQLLDNFSVSSAVPEPSTWAMLLLGFAGLGYAGYRSSRKGAPIAA